MKEWLELNRKSRQWGDHDQTVTDTFPEKNSVQNGLADNGIVKKVLESMGDEHRILHSGKPLNSFDRVLDFVESEG